MLWKTCFIDWLLYHLVQLPTAAETERRSSRYEDAVETSTYVFQRTMSSGSLNFTQPWTVATANISQSRGVPVPEPPLYLVVLLSVAFSLIFLFGVSGNLLVTAVVLRGRTLRTSVNYFLISLCIADLLVIIVCMPSAWVDVYAQDVWYFGETLCKLVPYLENVVAGASVYTILCICVERYKAICQPLHRSNEAMCRVVKIVLVIWILCGFVSLPFAFFPVYRDSVWLDGTPIKVCRHPMKYSWQKAYLVAIPAVFFFLPLLILLALYCRVGRVLIPHRGDTGDAFDESFREKMRQRRQGINIVASIVTVFFACHLPYRVISLWLIFESKEVLSGLGLEAYLAILYFARIAFYLNHALNPILYNFVSRKFRAELRRMCHTCRCRLPTCVLRDSDTSSSIFKTSRTFSPPIHFQKARIVNPENPKPLMEDEEIYIPCTTSATRKFRNDFSGLYASVRAADDSIDGDKASEHVSEIKKHFTGQIKCEGAKKKITSLRLFIHSTGDGFAINVDLRAKRSRGDQSREKNHVSSKTTYI